MIRYLLAAVLAVTMAASTFAVEIGSAKADAAYGVRYAEEQIVSLPQDQNKPYLTVFGSPADPKFKAINAWFKSNENLVAIKDQTHFNSIATTSAMYRERYAKGARTLPCVRLQTADGEPIVELAGRDVPMTGEALAKALNRAASDAECFRRHRECTPPDRDPEPQPLPPDVTPDNPLVPQEPKTPWLLVLGLTVVGGLAALVRELRGSFKGTKSFTKK